MVIDAGCPCLFATMVEIHSLQEYNTAFELRAARKMISTEEPGSKATFQQRMVQADLLCSGLGEEFQKGAWRKGCEVCSS